jgi:hypothetical protein
MANRTLRVFAFGNSWRGQRQAAVEDLQFKSKYPIKLSFLGCAPQNPRLVPLNVIVDFAG